MSNPATSLKLSRSQVLIGITGELFRDTKASALAFSKLLFGIYLDLVPEPQRQIDIKHPAGDDADHIIEKQYKRLQRYLDGTVSIPLDLEEAWVAALPEGYRARAITQLCGRYGTVAVQLDQSPGCGGVAAFMATTSAFMEHVGAMIDDGVIDESDAEHIMAARQACRAMKSAGTALINSIEEKLNVPPEQRYLHAIQLNGNGQAG